MKIEKGWAFPDDDEFMVGQMDSEGHYQLSHLLGAIEHCRNFALCVDGGAHIGTWSKVLAEKFRSVHSFEPSPDTFECLQHNVGGIANITLHNKALGKTPGKVSMTLEGFQRAIDMKNTGARFTKEGGAIERITLDSMNLPALDFLKLDIEGGEVDALMGARATLIKYRPVVLFEDKYLWKRYGYARNKPHEILASLGARKITRLSMDEVWGWK